LSEHLGYGWNRLLHPEDAPRSLKAWRAAVAGRAPYGLEYRVRRHDGSYEWFRVIGRPIRDGLGAIARWFGVAMNIDVLKRTEQTLQQRTRELEALLDTIPAMVCVKDASLRNIRVNRAFAEEFGLDRAHIEGRSDAQLLPPELARISLESDRRVMRDGCSLEAEEQSWLDGNGRRRWVATSKTPIFGDDDRATGLVGVSMDITESKLAEAERLAAMERQRDTLVREVHHRIKNHLQGVIGLLDNQAEDHPEVADPLRDTIAQVRTIAQVYGLQSRRNDARVSLRELIDVAANSAAEKVQCRLQDVGKTELAQAEAVPVALVVNELITNALKHRKSTGRPVQVALEKLPEGMRIRIRGGPSQLPAAFDFTTGRGLGTGLELIRLLLPPHGAKLCMRQDDEEVVAELWLSPPVLQP
jgi:PAS domain S-box-containing protein